MNSDKKIAIIVGALFLTSYCGVFIGSTVLVPILNAPDYLINVSANKSQVIIGMFLEFINAAAVVGIAVLMFSLLKKQNESTGLCPKISG